MVGLASARGWLSTFTDHIALCVFGSFRWKEGVTRVCPRVQDTHVHPEGTGSPGCCGTGLLPRPRRSGPGRRPPGNTPPCTPRPARSGRIICIKTKKRIHSRTSVRPVGRAGTACRARLVCDDTVCDQTSKPVIRCAVCLAQTSRTPTTFTNTEPEPCGRHSPSSATSVTSPSCGASLYFQSLALTTRHICHRDVAEVTLPQCP